jgi:predicted secreted Zn-dependent protease
MPKLPNSYNFKHNIKSTFNNYYKKLLAHEKNHKKYAVQAAKEIDKKILSLGTYKNCTSLKKSLVRKTNRIFDKYKKKNIDYDKRTKHGHTEGANISDYIK